eukprot:TRINITY_DN28153_c2_g1_i1.p1 TRINITY_DN28153_c2_g1~~TRINITY_DN28153_c2_g1_i1.p1  ORF type:complete len:929 (-),score=208.18 TRINITY_DN28153_c2_g1_i1:92-2878(-)
MGAQVSRISPRSTTSRVSPEILDSSPGQSSCAADERGTNIGEEQCTFEKLLPGAVLEEQAVQRNMPRKEAGGSTAAKGPVLLTSRANSKTEPMRPAPCQVQEADASKKLTPNTRRRLSVISQFDTNLKLSRRRSSLSKIKDRLDNNKPAESEMRECISDLSSRMLCGLDLEGVPSSTTNSVHRRRLTLVSLGGTEGGINPGNLAPSAPGHPRQRRRRSSMLSDESIKVGVSDQPFLRPRQCRRRSSMLSMLSESSSRIRASKQTSSSEAISEDSGEWSDCVESDPGISERSSDGFGSSSSEAEDDAVQVSEVTKDQKQQLKVEARRNSGAFCDGMLLDRSQVSEDTYVLPLSKFLEMDKLRSFEELHAAGSLQKMEPDMKTIFVASNEDQDPEGYQIKILQGVVQNLAEGTAAVEGDLRRPEDAYSTAELSKLTGEKDLFIWLRYCCMPASPSQQVQLISAIPLIVERCIFFVILPHPASGAVAQGWFRLALSARALALRDTRALLVQDEKMLRTICSEDFLLEPPCAGHFDSMGERTAAIAALRGLVEEKRDTFIEEGRVQDYRLLRALQRLLLRGAGMKDAEAEIDAESDSGLGSSSEDSDGGSKTAMEDRHRMSTQLQVSRRISATSVTSRSDQMRVWDFLRTYGLVSAQRPDELGLTAQHYAAISGKPMVSKSLVAVGSDVEVQVFAPGAQQSRWPSFKGMSPLHFSALLGPKRSDTAEALLNHAAKIDAEDAQRRTPLMLCGRSGNAEVATLLIESRANVHHQDAAGNTSLHQAAACGQEEMVELLTKVGASSMQTSAGTTPLFDLAFCSDSPKIVHMLLAASCKVDEALTEKIVDAEAVFKQFLASKPSTSQHLLPLLLKHHGGMTPLMAAAVAGNGKVAGALLKAGADPTRRNKAGMTAADLAREAGFESSSLKPIGKEPM